MVNSSVSSRLFVLILSLLCLSNIPVSAQAGYESTKRIFDSLPPLVSFLYEDSCNFSNLRQDVIGENGESLGWGLIYNPTGDTVLCYGESLRPYSCRGDVIWVKRYFGPWLIAHPDKNIIAYRNRTFETYLDRKGWLRVYDVRSNGENIYVKYQDPGQPYAVELIRYGYFDIATGVFTEGDLMPDWWGKMSKRIYKQ